MRALKLFLLILLIGTGFADLNAEESGDNVKTVYSKNTVIDFNEVNIEGELTRPEGSYLMNRKQAKFNKLYKIRGHFRQELMKSTDNL